MRHTNRRPVSTSLAFVASLIWASTVCAQTQTTSFTYQGRLTDGGTAASGNYDLQFALFDNGAGGTQIGSTLTRSSVLVSGGIFAVQLDFGVSAFPGANRFVEIGVRPANVGSFAILSPRQQISSTPYAIRTLNATTADALSSACVACVQDSQINQVGGSKVNGTIPVASVPDLSASYIKNTTSPQSSSNFNITGDGTAAGTLNGNVVNATTQYNLGGNRVLSAAGNGNLFAGVLAGQVNTSGTSNVFVGPSAGRSNTIGSSNSFFGFNAGFANVGDNAGNGNGNSFFGSRAGNNSTGSLNSFFGAAAGLLNSTGSNNSFFGYSAGSGNTGSQNSFFGVNAGNNSAGDSNNFFGYYAGLYNTGNGNNFFGTKAGLGDSNGSTGSYNSVFGESAGNITTGDFNSFFGDVAGFRNTSGSNNTFIGHFAGNTNNTQVSNSTAIGDNAAVACSHCMVLGDANDTSLYVGIGTSTPSTYSAFKLGVEGGGNLGGVYGQSSAPSGVGVSGSSTYAFGVYGFSTNSYGVYGASTNSYAGYFNGKIHVASVPFGSGTPVCVTFGGDIVACSSSLRFKTNVHPFLGGLDIIQRLRPINFNWKDDGRPDVGLGAEDVAKVAPSFAIIDNKGEIAGVKYDRLNILLINAVKEQQKEIELQHREITQLKEQVRRLRVGSRGQRKR